MTEHFGPRRPPNGDASVRSPLKRAYLALEQAHARIADLERSTSEPIAVIGLGCRMPGANSPQDFWQMLQNGVDAISKVPTDRFDVDAFYDPDPNRLGCVSTRYGGFLREINRFDCGFFGISPREAQSMDPQQRLLLEVVWEALEHAGQAPDRLEHTPTGIYVGVTSSDYAYLQVRNGDVGLLDSHYASGVAHSVISGRVSYFLGTQGPSLTIDTACSSSLVAVHLACQALHSGDCRMAIAGGVNLILGPELFVALSHCHMLSPDGRCKTFAASADGFSRGEGCGVVVLKRQADAEADGDRILALIRGSAVNQDGPSSGLTAPNGPAQEAVIRTALVRAGLKPQDIGYVEAHGTGTQLGDPIEMRALGAVFSSHRDPNQPLIVGSVKTNIGHLESAAGVSGLIKLILALCNQQIPANLHFDMPSPQIAWAGLPFRVPVQSMHWEPIGGRRIGGVSSFGFSGTNAHIIVEEAPVRAMPAKHSASSSYLLTLSARNEQALCELAKSYAEALRSDDDLASVCRTANTGRAHFAHRAVIVGETMSEMRSGLTALAQGERTTGLQVTHVTGQDPPGIAFLFSGQGSQYAGMARELYEISSVFKTALDQCAELTKPHMDRGLLDILFANGAEKDFLDQTAYTQPALFSVEYAIAELWRSCGITPNVVAGHSVGEYTAACVAGIFSLEDALRLICKRGALMQSLAADGAMAAIFASEKTVAAVVAQRAAYVSIAALNGPDQTVISGRNSDVVEICKIFEARGTRCQPLPVSHAFHSPLMDPILDQLQEEAKTLRFTPPRVRLISNLTGRPAVPNEITQPDYWRRHAREAVRFSDGLKTLASMKPQIVVEIGPNPSLLSFARSTFADSATLLIPSLRKGRSDGRQMLDGLASAYLGGSAVDWGGVNFGEKGEVVDLPTYPFQRERYWFKAKHDVRSRSIASQADHPLLGRPLRSAGVETIYESHLGTDAIDFIRQHRVLGKVILPAAAFLEMLVSAAGHFSPSEAISIEDVTLSEAMVFEGGGDGSVVQTVCGSVEAGSVAVSISSSPATATVSEPWLRHMTAKLRIANGPLQAFTSLDQYLGRCSETVEPENLYATFERRGVELGSSFRVLRQLRCGQTEAIGEVVLGADLVNEASKYRLHPVLLDGCLQVIGAAFPRGEELADALYLPIGVARFVLYRRPSNRIWCYAVVRSAADNLRRVDLKIFDADGSVAGELYDVQLTRVKRDAFNRLSKRRDQSLWETQWKPAPIAGQPLVTGWNLAELSKNAACNSEALRLQADIDNYAIFLPRFETLCAEFITDAMLRLGWTPARGENVTEDELATRLGIVGRHRRLFGRLLEILADVGLLARDGGGWQVVRPIVEQSSERRLERLAADCPPRALPELELTGRVAKNLASALRGNSDPMELLFPRGSVADMEKIYRDSPSASFFNGLIVEVVAAAIKSRGFGRPLRILEIGGGTGGTTAHLAPRLPTNDVEYVFTDVGPTFVAAARDRFQKYAFMSFDLLNLERDPELQGFAGQHFDLIIASNVIHATSDVRRTLARVRRLVAPGGLLAMLEVTAPLRWFDLTVGLTPGWWAFEDKDLRPNYPLMTRDNWIRVLSDSGFDNVAPLPGESQRECLALQSLLLARATVVTHASREWLLFADHAGVVADLADKLRKYGDNCILVRPGSFKVGTTEASINYRSAEDYRHLLENLRSSGRSISGVVHGWSLDCARWDDLALADLDAAEDLGVVSAMLLAQALVKQHPAPRLWLLTRGAQKVDPDDDLLSPAQAPVWGLGKSLSLEHADLRCVCVDLAPKSFTAEVDALLAELGEPGLEQQIALRQSGRRLARLAKARSTDADKLHETI